MFSERQATEAKEKTVKYVLEKEDWNPVIKIKICFTNGLIIVTTPTNYTLWQEGPMSNSIWILYTQKQLNQ